MKKLSLSKEEAEAKERIETVNLIAWFDTLHSSTYSRIGVRRDKGQWTVFGVRYEEILPLKIDSYSTRYSWNALVKLLKQDWDL